MNASGSTGAWFHGILESSRASPSRLMVERLGRLLERLAKREVLPSVLLGKPTRYALGATDHALINPGHLATQRAEDGK